MQPMQSAVFLSGASSLEPDAGAPPAADKGTSMEVMQAAGSRLSNNVGTQLSFDGNLGEEEDAGMPRNVVIFFCPV